MSTRERESSGAEPRTPTEAGLVPAVAQRQEGAMEALYDTYAPLAFSVAIRMLGERQAAEDVTQEAFLNAWRAAATYNPRLSSERSWLMSIVRNRCIDRLRGNASRPVMVSDELLHDRPGSHDVWQEVSRSVTAEQVRAALDGLPNEQRQAVELAYYGGFTQQEIANLTAVPLGTVKGRIRLAMQRLESLFAPEAAS